jgi:signal transduction histidine kinase
VNQDMSELTVPASPVDHTFGRKDDSASMGHAAPGRIEMLATLAHELRNPLAAIQSAMRALEGVETSAGLFQQACSLIDRQVRRIACITDDLLNASYLATGKLVVRKQRIDLTNTVIEAVECCRPLLDAGGHDLVLQLPPEAVAIAADPIRMVQVLTNLLDNAVKYSERHGAIVLSVEPRVSDVVIRLVDQGIGISANHLPHIFDLFVQADQPCGRTQGGLGIGLSLVKHIVELHGGTVEAFSAGLGTGSTFTLHIPTQESASSPLEAT